jgi:hypothetical protein
MALVSRWGSRSSTQWPRRAFVSPWKTLGQKSLVLSEKSTLSPILCAPIGSHVYDNDPTLMEKALHQGKDLMQPNLVQETKCSLNSPTSPEGNVREWVQLMATDSEAVSSDGRPIHIVDCFLKINLYYLQSISVRILKRIEFPTSTWTSISYPKQPPRHFQILPC